MPHVDIVCVCVCVRACVRACVYACEMAQELWRFSARTLANNLKESDSAEFRSSVLLLKLMEKRLLDHQDQTCERILQLQRADGDGLGGKKTWRGGEKETEGGAGVKEVGEMVGSAVEKMEKRLMEQIGGSHAQLVQRLAQIEDRLAQVCARAE